ncbi:class II glutamine amidotransferase [Jiella sonneratiae]|uniref:Class II glutamine amidotransferase n=1 Tax=Jiella sonneratiae TaxID=2816856 RepID=A0ABS3J9H4_9HYPH|nr:class II glutamine amidotransferase [Jiella sonneratiae]
MCRLLAYAGPPVFLDSLLVEPRASLIAQSMAARRARTPVNADGSGIGWYGERHEPGLYRSVVPAWSDANLVSLCRQIRSPLFMAHVRAATSGEVSTANCHPFTDGRALFTHNGQIGRYALLRRRVEALIPDELYHLRQGSTDSEAIFLASRRAGLAGDAAGALAKTLSAIAAIRDAAGIGDAADTAATAAGMALGAASLDPAPLDPAFDFAAGAAPLDLGAAVPQIRTQPGSATGETRGPCGRDDTATIRFAAVHADGSCLTACRWADDGQPPSLYWRAIETASGRGTVIASEPSDEAEEDWHLVPPSSVLTAWPDGRMTLKPFDPLSTGRPADRPAPVALQAAANV